jgi:hypothetical protein
MAHHFSQTAGQMATQMVSHLLPGLAVKPAPKTNRSGSKASKKASKSGSAPPQLTNAAMGTENVAPDPNQVANTAAPEKPFAVRITPGGLDVDRVKVAQDAWADVFHRNAYTNFSQINYLKDKAGLKEWDDILRDPKLLKKAVTKQAIEADTSIKNVLTWATSGRCST